MAKRLTSVRADGSTMWSNSHGVLTAAADNVLCSRLSEAALAAMNASAGDAIDRGLALLAELKKQGFGVIYLGEPEHAADGVSLVAGEAVSLEEAHLVGYWKGFDDARKGLAGLSEENERKAAAYDAMTAHGVDSVDGGKAG